MCTPHLLITASLHPFTIMIKNLTLVSLCVLPYCFSPKEESELTMCTDVDRNDKSRICEPGSVRVLGRRQIEMYSR